MKKNVKTLLQNVVFSYMMSTARTIAPTASDATYCCNPDQLEAGATCVCPYTNCANMAASPILNTNKSSCEGAGAHYCDRDNPSNSSCPCAITAPASTACSVTSPIS